MRGRILLTSCLLGMLLLLCAPLAAQTGDEETFRVRDARDHLGETVVVKGRTGIRVEKYESAERRVYTLRDDYGDQILVRTGQDYPKMGVTLLVEGTLSEDAESRTLFLDEVSQESAYPAASKPLSNWLLGAIGGALAVVVVIIIIIVRHGSSAPAQLEEAWGYAAVTSGPDQGKNFALRGHRILVGRGQDPTTAISFELDTNISRNHGVISRVDQTMYYEDTNSRNGSWIGEQQVAGGSRVPLPPGTLLRLGPTTILRIETGAQRGGQTMNVGGRGEDMTRRAR